MPCGTVSSGKIDKWLMGVHQEARPQHQENKLKLTAVKMTVTTQSPEDVEERSMCHL